MSSLNKVRALTVAACLASFGGLLGQAYADGDMPSFLGTTYTAPVERGMLAQSAGALGVQLAKKHRKRKKPPMKTANKKRRCGIELRKKLIDLPTLQQRVRNLAAIGTVRLKKIRGRNRRVVVVSVTAAAVRRDMKRRFNRAGNPKAQIAAIDVYINIYKKELASLRKYGFVEKPSRRVGAPPKSMRESLKSLLEWRNDVKASLPAPPKKQAQGKACPPQKILRFAGRWLVNANGHKFLMRLDTKGKSVTGKMYGIAKVEPVITRVTGAVDRSKIKFARINNRTSTWRTQKYSGTMIQTNKGRWIIGTFLHKGKPYKWCAVDARLVKRASWKSWGDCTIGGRPR